MARGGEQPLGSMGTDTPLAALSNRPQLLYNYFKQLFAQVTNPPIDPIREELVMSLSDYIGRDGNLLSEEPGHCRQLRLDSPVLTNADLEKIVHFKTHDLKAIRLPMWFFADDGPDALKDALDKLVRSGVTGLERRLCVPDSLRPQCRREYRSDSGADGNGRGASSSGSGRERGRRRASLLKRAKCGKSCTLRLLLGYGASAVNPYLAFETLADCVGQGLLPAEMTNEKAEKNFIKAISKGTAENVCENGNLYSAIVSRGADFRSDWAGAGSH